MIHNLKPYPAYKDSGVEWLGEVPEHWEAYVIEVGFRPIPERIKPPTSEMLYYDDGTVPWYGPSSCGTTEELRATDKAR